MKGFCISLDVSKGTSFYQGFKGIDEPITKPKKIEHNLEGFKELLNLKEKIRKEYNEDPIVIFESTGVYHKALQTYLDEHEFEYTIISPLLSAKVRKSDIRGTKTDAKDCASIAKVFYLKELRIYSKTDEIYDDLKEKIRNSLDVCKISNRSRKIKHIVLHNTGDICGNYSYLPFKEIDDIPIIWFKATERVLLDSNEQINPQIVRMYAVESYHQYILDKVYSTTK